MNPSATTHGGSRPIFLVGTGRCGSTILYSCLAMHPDFAWISSWLSVAPRWPSLCAFNRLWDLPGTARWREARFLPKPVEPNEVFVRWDEGYLEEGVTPERLAQARAGLLPLAERILSAHGRPRLLAKMVGRPVSVTLLAEVFPDAFFIHITRDLKPTTASLLVVEFYHGTDFSIWPWGPIPPAYLELYNAREKAPELGAAIVVRHNLDELHRQLGALPAARWMTIPYAGFIADPVEGLRQVSARAGFDLSPRFLDEMGKRKVYGGADKKWQKLFTPAQIANLDAFERLTSG